MLSTILSAIGLAMPAGLNAWLPFVVLSLADRYTSLVELHEPFDLISSTPGLIVILLLLPIELLVDKVPGPDHISDRVHTGIRPVAGAILAAAMANSNQDLNVWLAAALGAVAAAAVHARKMRSRPIIRRSTGGIGNPIASIVEDAAAGLTAIIAVVFPLALIATLPLTGAGLYAAWNRLERGSARLRAAAQASNTQ